MLRFSPYLSKNVSFFFFLNWYCWLRLLSSIWPKHSTLHCLTMKRHMFVRYAQRLNGWRSEVSGMIRCTACMHPRQECRAGSMQSQGTSYAGSAEEYEPKIQGLGIVVLLCRTLQPAAAALLTEPWRGFYCQPGVPSSTPMQEARGP